MEPTWMLLVAAIIFGFGFAVGQALFNALLSLFNRGNS